VDNTEASVPVLTDGVWPPLSLARSTRFENVTEELKEN